MLTAINNLIVLLSSDCLHLLCYGVSVCVFLLVSSRQTLNFQVKFVCQSRLHLKFDSWCLVLEFDQGQSSYKAVFLSLVTVTAKPMASNTNSEDEATNSTLNPIGVPGTICRVLTCLILCLELYWSSHWY